MSEKNTLLQSPQTIRLLKELEVSSALTQRSLSEKAGISLGKTNYILKALAARGIITLRRFKNSRQKSAYLYLLTPGGMKKKTVLARKFLNQKVAEYERLRKEIEELRRYVSTHT